MNKLIKNNYYSLFIAVISGFILLSSCSEEGKGDEKQKQRAAKEKVNSENNRNEADYYESDQELSPNVIVAGNVIKGAKASLVVEANTPDGVVRIGQTFTDAEGNFNIKGHIKDMGLYQLRLEERRVEGQEPKVVPMTLVPDDSVFIQLDFNSFNVSPQFSGTSWSEVLNGYFEEMKKFSDWQQSLENPQQYGNEKLMAMVMEAKKSMDDFTVKAIKKNPSNPANIVLMSNLFPMMGYDYWDDKHLAVLQNLHKNYQEAYPEHPMTKSLGTQLEQLQQSYSEYVDFKEKNIAPNIVLSDPNGETRQLSDLKGNYVLIDFWASWCGPCRMENPNVVRLYRQYKDKGFEIFSVSLDTELGRWKKAIEADGLIWKNHVSDLKGWKADVVSQYQFNAIPHTVLLDPDGKIIATKLRSHELERKLQEIFG